MRVGFVGLGIMGSRMASNLLAKGHELVVWNRSAARAEELRGAGARCAGTLLLMCGGTAEAFTAAQPILQAVGSKAVHVGEVAQATTVKLIGNLIIAHMVEALSEGATLAQRAGISVEKLLEVVQSSGFA